MKPKRPRRTDKQKEIMGIILREVSRGRFLTQQELYALISYRDSASFGALRVSVRFLEEQGMLLREGPRGERVLKPTEKGYDWFRPLWD